MAKITEFRGKTNDELRDLAISLKKKLFNLRFQVASGELTDNSQFSKTRRDIAKIKTLLNEPKSTKKAVGE